MKTTTINYCIKRVMSEVQTSSTGSLSFLYINGANVHSSSHLFSEMASILNVKSVEKIENRLQKLDHPLILVIDEIDLLMRQLFGPNGEMNMSNLFSWASDSSYKLIFIGISNSVGSKDAKKIVEKVCIKLWSSVIIRHNTSDSSLRSFIYIV
jgi:Cdc6-like AAA superfamily ATPase